MQEHLEWFEAWILEMVRVTKLTGSIYVQNIPKWLTYYAGFLNKVVDFKYWIAWDAPTMPIRKTLLHNHYGILFYAKNNKELKFYEGRYPHKRDGKTSFLSKDYGLKSRFSSLGFIRF